MLKNDKVSELNMIVISVSAITRFQEKNTPSGKGLERARWDIYSTPFTQTLTHHENYHFRKNIRRFSISDNFHFDSHFQLLRLI